MRLSLTGDSCLESVAAGPPPGSRTTAGAAVDLTGLRPRGRGPLPRYGSSTSPCAAQVSGLAALMYHNRPNREYWQVFSSSRGAGGPPAIALQRQHAPPGCRGGNFAALGGTSATPTGSTPRPTSTARIRLPAWQISTLHCRRGVRIPGGRG